MKDFIKRNVSQMKSLIDYALTQMSEIAVVAVTFLLSAAFLTVMIFSKAGRAVTIIIGGACVIALWLYVAYKFYNYAIALSKDKGQHRITIDYDSPLNDGQEDDVEPNPTDLSPDTYQLSFDDYLNEKDEDDEGE